MIIAELSDRERGLANYIVDKNKSELNRISKDCVAPLVIIRKVCKGTAEAIGVSELKEEEVLSNEEWVRITNSIYNSLKN